MAARNRAGKPVYLITGDDPSLVANEVRDLLEELLGDRDPSLVVEEVGGSGNEELDLGAVIDSFTTPPFLVDLRIVVLRDAGRLDTAGSKQILEVLDPPPPGAVLVIGAGHGALPRGFAKSVTKFGDVLDVSARRFGERKTYVTDHLRSAPVRFNASAQKMLLDHLGEDLGRLNGLLETLAAAYGEGVTIDEAMLTPFLGSQGSVPIFDLTDAIDSGNVSSALGVVDRMMGPGGESGHVIVASLDGHFSRVARLDGTDLRSGDDAATLLGINAYPAKKALDLSRRVDTDGIRRAIGLVADADLDLKGMSGLDERVVIEILVARLARLLSSYKR